MRKSLALITIGSLSAFWGLPTAFFEPDHDLPKRAIVVFDNDFVNSAAQDELVARFGDKVRDLRLINGKTVILPDAKNMEILRNQRGVKRVEEDVEVHALDFRVEDVRVNGKGTATPPPQSLPWGVNRIDADASWALSKGTGIKVAVIDTGIDKTHSDLAANIKGGRNFVFKNGWVDPANWNDDNGHGTHVAGIIAAQNNTIGVVGVAPEAWLYGVKVLDRRGSGYVSDVIAGIDWAVTNSMNVINLSLGTNSDIQSLHDAVDRAYGANVLVVAAAGNDGDTNPDDDVDYPARYSSVIAVSATDSLDRRASWSSDGLEVELAAPGVSISSTWKGNTYKTISGTSMASPHVAGTAALVLALPVNPAYDTDSNGLWSTSEIRALLRATADDLGASGFDNYYGNGLVDSQEAVTGLQVLP